MKTNEIPEKIVQDGIEYYRVDTIEELTYDKETFVRKDIFIEKACEWLREHRENVETEDNGIMGWIPDYFIDDFVNYMKG